MLLAIVLTSIFIFLFISTIYFTIGLPFKQRISYRRIQPFFILMNIMVIIFMIVVFNNQQIFHERPPFDIQNSFASFFATKIPVILLILFIPIVILNYRIIKDHAWKTRGTTMFTLNTLVLLALIILCANWGFYNVF